MSACITRAVLVLALFSTSQTAFAQTAPEPAAEEAKAFACFDPVPPVTELAIPSRYKDDSKNRSDFDAEANAAVEAALNPVDDFINLLVKNANAALQITAAPEVDPEAPVDPAAEATSETPPDLAQQTLIADCVVDRIHDWAAANALGDMKSQGAQLSVPSRIGGIAMAYAQVRSLATQDTRQPEIEAWLTARMQSSMVFFDTEAPPKSRENNLRAWAALAAAQVGLLQNDEAMTTWAAESVKLVLCTATPEGALPNEMWRGKLALHYQIHAVGPLVVANALLQPTHPDLLATCDNALLRVVRFTLKAVEDPKLVEAITDKPQKFDPATEMKRAFQFAWLAPLETLVQEPEFTTFAAKFELLSNSKIGGKQSLLWPALDAKDPAATEEEPATTP
ncbi:alginate lyase family protein [Cypionkella psychrotolerans]|uniref:alginate lyase family protein n=1 Tax=Cypionkella psychrotolerans TaxID=1678131 RepID=UPI0006B47460|nr:alginate lyase family protein [Cypionkella psychrotolerans]